MTCVVRTLPLGRAEWRVSLLAALLACACACARGGGEAGFLGDDPSVDGSSPFALNPGSSIPEAGGSSGFAQGQTGSFAGDTAEPTDEDVPVSGQSLMGPLSLDAGATLTQPSIESNDGETSDDAFEGESNEAPFDASDEEVDQDVAEASVAPLGQPPPPTLGELLITEVMFDPSGPRPESEWFEVYNTATTPRLLSGLTLVDGSGRQHLVGSDPPVIAPSRQFVLLVRDASVAIGENVPSSSIVYDYGAGSGPVEGIQLTTDQSGGLSIWSGVTELAAVSYGGWDAAWVGESIELASVQLVGSDDPTNWCVAVNAWVPGSDDGTPGSPNDCN